MKISKNMAIAGAFLTTAVLVFLATNKTKIMKKFLNITATAQLRGVDNHGSGAFGVARDGGTRKHQGLDFLAAVGEKIYSPIAGKIKRITYPYEGTIYKGVEIVNDDVKIKIFYFSPIVALVGKEVLAGQVIGKAQNIAAKYAGIKNHVHIEIRNAFTGDLINPETLF